MQGGPFINLCHDGPNVWLVYKTQMGLTKDGHIPGLQCTSSSHAG